MMVLFHNTLPQILENIENTTSCAIHNSTFSDSMGGDVLSIDHILGALFDTDEVKDDVLMFEVRITTPEMDTVLSIFSYRVYTGTLPAPDS